MTPCGWTLANTMLLLTAGMAGIAVVLKGIKFWQRRGSPYNWLRAVAVIACLWAVYNCVATLVKDVTTPITDTNVINSLPPFMLLIALEAAHAIREW